MVNPRLVEMYGGEDKCKFLEEFSYAIGEETAMVIYVLPGNEQEYNGSIVPRSIMVRAGLVLSVERFIYQYLMSNYYNDKGMNIWITVHAEYTCKPGEGIQLWLP